MNNYGLDVNYFTEKLSLLIRDMDRYTPAEMARALARLSVAADPAVINEPEFSRHNQELVRIGNLLKTQDNRGTADPVFVVFSKQEIVVDEKYDHDRVIWVDEEGGEVTGLKAERLERLHKGYRDIDEDKYRRIAVKAIDQFETACFTEQGCKDYLKVNGHNLCSPYIYAHSFFRNSEMLELRKLMSELAKQSKLEAV